MSRKEYNQAAISLAQKSIANYRTKHIEFKHHPTKQLVELKKIKLQYITTDKIVADIMTKSLGYIEHRRFPKEMGMDIINI